METLVLGYSIGAFLAATIIIILSILEYSTSKEKVAKAERVQETILISIIAALLSWIAIIAISVATYVVVKEEMKFRKELEEELTE